MKQTRRWLVLMLALVMVASLALAGCGGTKTEDKNEGETSNVSDKPAADYTLVEAGTLTVGSDTSFPPFESMNGNVAEGFDVDLMNAIGEELGLKVVFKTEIFDTLIPTLKAGGKFDVIASAMTIKDDRKKEIDFTDPYFDSNQSIAMKKGSTFTGYDQFNGKKVGVQSGTTGSDWAKENLTGATLVPFKTATEAFSALQAGNVEAVVNDLPVTLPIVNDATRGLEMVKEIATGEQYGFGVSKSNPNLLKALNEALAKVKESGQYDEIYTKWIGQK